MSEARILRAIRRIVMQRMSDQGLNLHTLAERSGLSVGCLSQLLSGKVSPRLKTIVAVCRALEIPWADLAKEHAYE